LYFAGGVHPLIQFMTVVGVYGCARAVLDRDLTPLRAYIMLAGWFACVSAFKLLVTLRYLYGYKPEYLIAFSPLAQLGGALLSRIADPSPEHEFNTYVGSLGVVLLILGLCRLQRAWLPLLAAAIGAALFSTERFARPLQQLPVLSTQGSFSRFRLIFVLSVGLVAALGLDAILKRALARSSRRTGILVQAVCCVLLAVFGLSLPTTMMARHVDNKSSTPFPELSRVHLEAPELVAADPSARVDVAVETVGVNEFSYRFSSRQPPNGPLYLVSPQIRRSPHKVPLRITGDGTIEEFNGRFAVKLTGSEGKLTLFYDRRWGNAGLMLSIASIGFWISLLLRSRSGRPRTEENQRARA
jgi:hypothetical protein